MIITQTPYRLSFFGGGTDYRPWFENKGGLVIASTISQYCYLSVRRLPPFFEHKTRAVYSKVEEVNSHKDIAHPSIKHCLDFLHVEEGLEIHHDGDLPARSGIGSSSSFTVGLLHALHAFRYEMVTKRTLADEAIRVEQELIGENVGIQDQIMAAHGGIQIIEMGPGDQYKVTPLILPPDYLHWLEQHVLLAFTGLTRNSNEFAQRQIQNIDQGKSLDHLGEMKAIAEEALKLFIQNANIEEIGRLMDHNWKLKRQLATGLTNKEIDDLYATARKFGAFGGKLCGAGGGGFFMLLAPPYKHKAIRQALSHIEVWVPFCVDMAGSQIIFHTDSAPL